MKCPNDNERGQAVVELAIALPILLLILFGIVQFGMIFQNYQQVVSGAREGARVASQSRSDANATSDIQAAVLANVSGLNSSNVVVTVSPSPPFVVGSDVTVTVTYPYNISILGDVVSSGSLTQSSTFVVQ